MQNKTGPARKILSKRKKKEIIQCWQIFTFEVLCQHLRSCIKSYLMLTGEIWWRNTLLYGNLGIKEQGITNINSCLRSTQSYYYTGVIRFHNGGQVCARRFLQHFAVVVISFSAENGRCVVCTSFSRTELNDSVWWFYYLFHPRPMNQVMSDPSNIHFFNVRLTLIGL